MGGLQKKLYRKVNASLYGYLIVGLVSVVYVLRPGHI